jgi:anti-sigma B factor antagonist
MGDWAPRLPIRAGIKHFNKITLDGLIMGMHLSVQPKNRCNKHLTCTDPLNPTNGRDEAMNRSSTLGQRSQQNSRVTDKIPVVTLRGEIDLVVAPDLQERLDDLLMAGSTSIVVDLTDVTFLDSIALGVLVGAVQQCRDADGDLHLILTDPKVLKVFEITDLLSTFQIHSELTDPYASVGS